MEAREVLVTGVTGYMGSRLAARLLARGHRVRGVVRAGSERRMPAGVEPVHGDALDATTWEGALRAGDTVVHLVGVAHPSPAKAEQFRSIDLVAARETIGAAARARASHVVYVSVAQPAPIMQAYVAVRAEVEAMLRASGLPATILRPWYVLGPGHWWPVALLPLYWAAGAVPRWRDASRRLRPVTLPRMLGALVHAVEHPPAGVLVVEAPAIRAR